MSSRILTLLLIATASIALAGCGIAKEDRTMGGTAAGAAMGAAVGGAFGGIGAGPGVLIGGVAGATVGAFTTPDQINFGEPLWNQFERVDEAEE